jgi:dCTP deaminase
MLSDWKIEAVFNTDRTYFTERQWTYLDELEELRLATGEITPFIKQGRQQGKLSTGLTSAGYDLSLSDKGLDLFSYKDNLVLDPLNFNVNTVVKLKTEEDSQTNNLFYTLPPHSSVLGATIEYFKIPNWLCGVVNGKSSYARTGLKLNVTPLEPGWEGYLVVEFFNTTPLPLKVYANQGLCQVQFYETGQVELCYSKKKGRYQHQQTGITYARS